MSYEAVNHPPHYTCGGVEAIDVIRDWGLGFSLGNAVKYICRVGRKPDDDAIQVLEKLRWYLLEEQQWRHMHTLFSPNRNCEFSSLDVRTAWKLPDRLGVVLHLIYLADHPAEKEGAKLLARAIHYIALEIDRRQACSS